MSSSLDGFVVAVDDGVAVVVAVHAVAEVKPEEIEIQHLVLFENLR